MIVSSTLRISIRTTTKILSLQVSSLCFRSTAFWMLSILIIFQATNISSIIRTNAFVISSRLITTRSLSSSFLNSPKSISKIPFLSSNPVQRPTSPLFASSALKQSASAFSSDSDNLTSNLISTLAVLALSRRLYDNSDVVCNVSSSPKLLVQGIVGPVTVKGKGWISPSRALTCHAIEATVDTCQLDLKRVLKDRKLVLTKPSNGKAMVALDDTDFANFITHPLMKPPAVNNNQREPNHCIEFIKEGTMINPEDGTVTFYATYANEKWKCILSRGESSAPGQKNRKALISVSNVKHERSSSSRLQTITATSSSAKVSSDQSETYDIMSESVTATVTMTAITDHDSDDSKMLTDVLSTFFNDMVFDLDGTYLRYRDMMVTNNKGATKPLVMLALNIIVKKFPSPGIDF